MASASTFEQHYVGTTSYIRVQRFHERKNRQNNQSRPQHIPVLRHACKSGPGVGFSSKSHVQTTRESHDLSTDFAASDSFAYHIPMQKSHLAV